MKKYIKQIPNNNEFTERISLLYRHKNQII